MQAKGITHMGRRENNEDFFLVDNELRLFIVADGMGGHNAGEVASSLAVRAVRDNIVGTFDRDNPAEVIQRAVRKANSIVFSHASARDDLKGMGTTLTAVWVYEKEAYVAHIGDSRAYLARQGELRLMTSDHSLVQEMVKNGGISEKEARQHPQRNVLTRAVGTQEDVHVDINNIALQENDVLLLCTDGLTSTVSDRDILGVFSKLQSAEKSCYDLIGMASKRGAEDNITAVVVYVDDGF